MNMSMTERLAGKCVLITGASSGIGRSTAFEFARASAGNIKLILTARRQDRLQQISQDLSREFESDIKVYIKQLDVSKPNEIDGLMSSLPQEFQEVDVLVNNA